MLQEIRLDTFEHDSGAARLGNDTPTVVNGNLTQHGVTRPVSLTIDAFKCMQQPMLKKEVCGADARGSFNRDDFGIDFGKQYGFNQRVSLRIQVEAIRR